MIFTYLQIFREADKQEKQMASRQSTAMLMHRSSVANEENAPSGKYLTVPDIDAEQTPCKDKHLKMRREHKAARTLGIIMGVSNY